MAKLVKYEIPMRSIYWRIAATIALCFAIWQIGENKTDSWVEFFYGFGQGVFVVLVVGLLWGSLPCKKTLVHREGE